MQTVKYIIVVVISSICAIYSLDKLTSGFAIRAVHRNDVPPSFVFIILHIIVFGICMVIDASAINSLIHMIAI